MPETLTLAGVGVRYGGVIALNDVSLTVAPGTTLGLIGPNGAGKTTLINATTGIAPLATGSIALGAFAVSMGVGLGFSYVSTAVLMQDYFGRRASLELYSVMTWISTSAAIGPGIGGIVRDRTGSFSGVFMAIAGIDLLLLLAVLVMRRPTQSAANFAAGAAAAE